MDANDRFIPIVEDDQGEGIKDPMTMDDILHDLYKVQNEYKDEVLMNMIKNHEKQKFSKPNFKRMQKK